MTYFVYILFSSKLQKYYIGQTNNVMERIERHNKGYENFTKKGIPWELIFFKEFATRSEAVAQERKLKNLKSKVRLEAWINKNQV